MKKYKIFNIPPLSFFSKELYRDVGLNFKGTCLGYLFLLLVICWLPGLIKVNKNLSAFIDEFTKDFLPQIPVVTITDGKASIQEPQPYYITSPDGNNILFIIDTTGTVASLEDTDALGLLTETSLIYQKSEIQTQTFDLNQIKELTITREKIRGWISTLKKILIPFICIFATLGSFILRIIQLLIYAAIGLLFVSRCKAQLKYDALIRLAVVAVTPCIIIKTILGAAGLHLPFAGLWYFLIAMVYLYFGVKATTEEENSPPLAGTGTFGPPESTKNSFRDI